MVELFWGSLLAAIVITWWLIQCRRMREGVRRMEHRFYDRKEER